MRKNNIPFISIDDYLTINEFSKMVNIPVKTLQYYDANGIFSPEKRDKNNYRLYNPMQITPVKMAKILRESGVLLKKIASYEKERTPKSMADLLLRNIDDIEFLIQQLADNCTVQKSYYKMITEGINANIDELSVRRLPEVPITMGEPTVFPKGESFFYDFLAFCMKERNPELNLNYAIGGFFDSMDTFLHHPSKPDRFYSLDPDGGAIREKGTYLIGYTHGYYGTTNDLPEKMAEFAKLNNLTFNGPVYNIFIHDELCITDPNKYLLKVAASVRKTDNKDPRNLKRKTKRVEDEGSE